MTKEWLINKINEDNFHFNKLKMKNWLNGLPTTLIRPNKLKSGDVFMHAIFRHPYMLLGKRGDYWVCTLFTSDKDFLDNLCKCQSRFFNDSYITRCLFTCTEPTGGFMGVYDNVKHLKEIKNQLKKILS